MNMKKPSDQTRINDTIAYLKEGNDREAMFSFAQISENKDLEGREVYAKFKAFKKAAGF